MCCSYVLYVLHIFCFRCYVFLTSVFLYFCCLFFFFSSRRRHTRCALVTGVQTCALPIFSNRDPLVVDLSKPDHVTLDPVALADSHHIAALAVAQHRGFREQRLIGRARRYARGGETSGP